MEICSKGGGVWLAVCLFKLFLSSLRLQLKECFAYKFVGKVLKLRSITNPEKHTH